VYAHRAYKENPPVWRGLPPARSTQPPGKSHYMGPGAREGIGRRSALKVSVKYYGLSSEVGIKEETVELDGSTYAALKAILDTKYHPLTYTPVLCLKDGMPMSPETKLRDRDTVNLVRQIGGG